MKENEMILKMKGGTEKKYEIVLSYVSLKNNNKYVIFTDNKKGSDGSLNLYAKKYNSRLEILEDINDEEEWKEVEKRIDDLNIGGNNGIN